MFRVDFVLWISSFKSQQTPRERRNDTSFVLQTHFLFHTPHFPVTLHQVMWDKAIQWNVSVSSGARIIEPFMLSVRCALDLCPGVNLREGECKCRNGKRSSSWKEVFRCVLFVSEVYPEGWKFVKRIKKYEKKWVSTLHAKQLAPDTWNLGGLCMANEQNVKTNSDLFDFYFLVYNWGLVSVVLAIHKWWYVGKNVKYAICRNSRTI